MENAIKTLRIQNFKSIKDVTIQPRRVNLIIGQPNVGKSNILEAMSLLGSVTYEREKKFMSSFIRYEEPRQMFYDNLVSNIIRVETDRNLSLIGFSENNDNFKVVLSSKETYSEAIKEAKKMYDLRYIFGNENDLILDDFVKVALGAIQRTGKAFGTYFYTEFDESATVVLEELANKDYANRKYFDNVAVKPYGFNKKTGVNREYKYSYLNPPYGDNLVSVIRAYPSIRKEISQLFEQYHLKLLLRIDERRLEVVKELDGIVYSYPYSSIADTLQRIIFYLAAIESNDDSVLLFEEPEAHTFPVYTTMLGQKIAESRNNQFFVATHSPYLLTEIIENLVLQEHEEELAIFLAYYENYQTKIYQLTDEEVLEIRRDAIDVFYNLSRYTPHANPYA